MGWEGAFCLPVFDGMQSTPSTCCVLAVGLGMKEAEVRPLGPRPHAGDLNGQLQCCGCQSKPGKA